MKKITSKTYKKLKKGFTVIEFIVVMSIFSVLSSVVLFNYNSFSRSTELSATVQDVALQIKEAQTSALNGRFPVLNPELLQNIPTSSWQPAYGLLFSGEDPTTIPMFYDYNGNNLPDPMEVGAGASLEDFFCEKQATECLSYLTLNKGDYIGKIYADAGGLKGQCASSFSVVFRRPFPDANMRFNVIEGVNVGSPVGSVHIQILGSAGGRLINISPIGQISATAISEDPCWIEM